MDVHGVMGNPTTTHSKSEALAERFLFFVSAAFCQV